MSYDCIGATILHELGHWLLAKENGFKAGGGIKIEQNNGCITGLARIYPEPLLDSVEDVKEYIKKRIMILLGGACAESLFMGTNSKMIMETTASDDNGKIVELSYIYYGLVYKKYSNSDDVVSCRQKLLDECWGKASTILNDKKGLMTYMYDRMYRPTVDGYNCTEEQLCEYVSDYRSNVDKSNNEYVKIYSNHF
jgi:hypothetical protein